MKALTIFGTRPEAVKMAPVVHELARHGPRIQPIVCVTAQHREMLDQVLRHFGIRPDLDLDLMEQGQELPAFAARALTSITTVIQEARPDLVLVQGDTTTAMIAALAAFYERIPVGHVEAGLRTGVRYSPFPEEINRHLITVLGSYHFAPTTTAAAALCAEGVREEDIFVTGNTVIDALHWTVAHQPCPETQRFLDDLALDGQRLLLVTAHRRENFDAPLEHICHALLALADGNPDVTVLYPVHLNPNVQGPVGRLLSEHPRIRLTEPLAYEPFVHLMNHSYLVLTDSGGLQEEAPALGKPVLVLRRETERPEAIEAGTVKLVGTDTEAIFHEAQRLLHDPDEYQRMAHAVSPYGDGHAAERIVSVLLERVP